MRLFSALASANVTFSSPTIFVRFGAIEAPSSKLMSPASNPLIDAPSFAAATSIGSASMAVPSSVGANVEVPSKLAEVTESESEVPRVRVLPSATLTFNPPWFCIVPRNDDEPESKKLSFPSAKLISPTMAPEPRLTVSSPEPSRISPRTVFNTVSPAN